MANPDLVVVDGPNFYNRVGEVLLRVAGHALHDVVPYMERWLDVDRVVAASIEDGEWPPPLGVALVHSDRPLGPKSFHLDDAATRRFWARQVRLPKCRDIPVRIPGDENDDVEFTCAHCGHLHRERVRGEKGVDATVITTLFESIDHWRIAVLAATDVDYAPAVEALHRLGRAVAVVGRRSDEGSALERRSHDFYEIPERWLAKDFGAFRCFRKGGNLDHVLPQLVTAGFEAGCRFVPQAEKRDPFHARHDFEVIVAHDATARPRVLDVVLNGLSMPALFVQERNPEMTVFTFEVGRNVMLGVDRSAEADAAWRAGTTFVFPERLLRRPKAP